MSAAPLIAQLSRKGIRLAVEGRRLKVTPASALSPELRDMLSRHKRELVALLSAADRLGLPHALVHRLSVEDIAACADLSADTLGAYLRVLDRGERMDRGEVPPGFTAARYCAGCGPVWLWPGCPERVTACPWCHRRRAGKPVPRP